MAISTIPIDPLDPSFRFRAELEGAVYQFAIDWNGRDRFWYVSIEDREGVRLLSGIKMVQGLNFFEGNGQNPGFPPGALVLLDTTLQGLEARRVDLGERNDLTYYSADELP